MSGRAANGKRSSQSSSAAPPPPGPPSFGFLKPYHVLYLSIVISIVLGGTAYSIYTGSNLYNSTDELDRLQILAEATSSSPTAHIKFLAPTSYFASKRNVFNQLFVKRAWLWNTVAFVLQAIFLKSPISAAGREAAQRKKNDDEPAATTASAQKANATKQSNITSPLSLSFFRFFVATFCWMVFAGWFFGPPLMIRILTATGGRCVPVNPTSSNSLFQLPETVDSLFCYRRQRITHTSHPELFAAGDRIASRVAASGGVQTRFQGGHDVSGHTFILVLSSLYLLEELAPFLPHLLPALAGYFPRQIWWPTNPFRSVGPAPVSTGSARPRPTAESSAQTASFFTAIAILALVGLWLFMLLMTQVYFHTTAEKITGLLFGLGAWLLLPKEM